MFPDSSIRTRNAFTLLELMIAIVLLSVLMVATWGLLDIFRNQFERNQVRVERWQIVRSVHDRIVSDLQSSAVVPPSEPEKANVAVLASPSSTSAPSTSASSTSASSTSLLGDRLPSSLTDGNASFEPATSLKIDSSFDPDEFNDIMNGGPAKWLDAVVGVEGDSSSLVLDVYASRSREMNWQDPNRPVVRDSVRRVVYSYRSQRDAMLSDGVPGLLRCELMPRELVALKHFATTGLSLELVLRDLRVPWIPEPQKLGLDQGEGSSEDVTLSLRDEVRLRDFMGRDFDQRVDYLPEIRKFRLRYFDGTFWMNTWSSTQQKQIPVAVELTFDLEDPYWLQPAEEELEQQAALELLAEETVDTEPLDPREQSAMQEPPEGFRFLIYLRAPEPSLLDDDSMAFGDWQDPLLETRSGVRP